MFDIRLLTAVFLQELKVIDSPKENVQGQITKFALFCSSLAYAMAELLKLRWSKPVKVISSDAWDTQE